MARIAGLSFFAIAGAAVGQSHNQFGGNTSINDPAFINFLNSENGEESTWVAGASARFDGMSFDDARALLGTELSHISEHLDKVLEDTVYAAIADVPASFDARSNWPGLIHPIRDQQGCGSCWAFSASEVLGDRVAIASKTRSPVLSVEDMVSCDTGNGGCTGGQFPKVKARSSYAINGAVNMQKELMTNGPIQVGFLVYKSFMAYKSGVYQKRFWELAPEGGHAVKMVGWGTDGNVDYWLVANSWNTVWGIDGFFKIKRGSNACGIEQMGPPYAGMPAIQRSESVLVV